MNEQPVVVRQVSWRELCPWSIIFRTLPVATSVSVLAFALLGAVATPMGWLASEVVWVDQELREDPFLSEAINTNRSPWKKLFPTVEDDASALNVMGLSLSGPRLVFEQMVGPFRHLFSGNLSLRGFGYFLFGCLWSIAVWSFVGVAIARICTLSLTRNESVPMDDAFEFAVDKFVTTIGAIGIPLLAVAALCVPGFLLGLLMGFDFGAALVSVVWFVVMAIGAAIALLLLGLLFAWPLIVSSVAAEGQNSFDAMTRSYAYTFQRPAHYAFYMLLAVLFGGFCWLIVSSLATAVIDLGWWSTSWGANIANWERVDTLRGVAAATAADGTVTSSGAFDFAQFLIGLWEQLLMTLASAFMYGLFWCFAAAIYLLLRHDVDETEMDEVYLVDEQRTYELPPLKSDENGIPQVQTPLPASEGDSPGMDETVAD